MFRCSWKDSAPDLKGVGKDVSRSLVNIIKGNYGLN